MFKRYLSDFIFELKMKKQRFKKGYSNSDCWSMHYWLGDTFPKMIKTLRDMKHGSPDLDFSEFYNLPLDWLIPELEKLEKIREKEGYEYNIYDCFDKWYIILTRIAYCLEQTNEELTEIKNEYAEQFHNEVWGENNNILSHLEVKEFDKKGNPKLYELKTQKPSEEIKNKYWKREEDIFNYRDKMKNEAFDLLKKYFWNLWD